MSADDRASADRGRGGCICVLDSYTRDGARCFVFCQDTALAGGAYCARHLQRAMGAPTGTTTTGRKGRRRVAIDQVRLRALWDARWPAGRIAAALGVSPSRLRLDARALGLKRPMGWKPPGWMPPACRRAGAGDEIRIAGGER